MFTKLLGLSALTVAVISTPLDAQDSSWEQRLGPAQIAVDEPGFHVWGSSPVIGPQGKTHLFVARWPVAAKFLPGWHTDCEIAHYVGEKPDGPFVFRDVALTGTGLHTWDHQAPHNPTIQKVGDQYALLYIANTGNDFPASQRIGMVLADSLDGPWKKVGTDGLLLSPAKDPDSWSHDSQVGVNNPALLQHPDGRFFLYYKAMRKGDVRRMGVAVASQLEGPYLHHPEPLTSNSGTIEDGYVFCEDDKVFLLTTDAQDGGGLLWASDDGIQFGQPSAGFSKMSDYLPAEEVAAAPNYYGRKFERPQVLIQDGHPTHLYVSSGANILKGDGSCSYVLPISPSDTRQSKATDSLPLPTAAQLRWQDCEVGVIFHFDISIPANDMAANNMSKTVFDPALYNPTKLDTDQWLAAAKAAGAEYAIFTATHFKGFLQWQSDLYPYGLKQAPWRHGQGDIVADFIASCHKVGIKPGIYFSTHRNAYQGVWGHYVDWGQGRGSEAQEEFNRLAEKMTEELCTRYGDLVQIWYDAGVMLPHEGGPDVLPIFAKHQPNSVFYNSTKRLDHRWIGNEGGFAGEPCWATLPDLETMTARKLNNQRDWYRTLLHGDPSGSLWSPAMVDLPLRGANGVHDWFWFPKREHGIYSTTQLVDIYRQSVGRNSNLILGIVINPDGLVPEADVIRLAEFGTAIDKTFSDPLAVTSGHGEFLEMAFDSAQSVHQVSIMEDIAKGERIREFVVEGLTPAGQWQSLCIGTSVGHKRILEFSAVEVQSIRLRITKSVGAAQIRTFAVYGNS
jgi:alpha-L-fucosidase